MSKSVFNKNNTTWKSGVYSLFLGEAPALLDSVNVTYPKLFDLYKLQKSMDWSEDEVNLEQSRLDLMNTSKNNYDIMIKTLAFQWELDSVASRAIAPLFAPFVSNSECWMMLMKQTEMECVAEGTEVLTPDGWVDISTVTVSDLVAQFNHLDKSITFVHPTHVIRKPYNGVMYSFKNEQNHFNQLVTPNHRMIQYNRKTDSYNTLLASDMDFSKGGNQSSLGAVHSGFKAGNNDSLTSLERLLIALQADGTVDFRGDVVDRTTCTISVKKDRKKKRLLEILQSIEDLEYVIYDENNLGFMKCKIILPLFYRDKIKDFSWINLKDVNHLWCSEFLDEVSEWDSFKNVKGNRKTVVYSNTNRIAVEKVQSIAVLCGMKTHCNVRGDDRSVDYKDVWVLSWAKTDFITGNSVKKTEVMYDGDVYCVTVPSGYFVMRYKHSASITGNCLHSLTYSEIIRQCLPDPKDVFAEVMHSDEVLNRSKKVVEVFDELSMVGGKYKAGMIDMRNPAEELMVRQTIAKALVALYCLEKIEFMASFACTFALAEQNIFQGIAKLVQKIAQDEQCVTADHQVLTTTGWKFISDVTIEDKVAQWDHPTNEIQFVNPIRVLKKLYTGEMYTLKSGSLKRVNQVVTDKHRIPVINPYSHSNREFVYAEDYKSSGASSIPVSGSLIQECPPLSALERLYIAFQADGTIHDDHFRNGKHTGCKVMIFNFKKERKLEGMLSILEELDFEYTYHENEDVRKDGDVYHVFRVSVPLEYFIDGMKDFGWIDYSKIDHKWIRSFINELVIWDSYTNRDGHYTYINTNKLAIDVVQTLCHLGGHKTTLITTKAHSRIIADGVEINAKECYRLSIFLDIAYQGGQCMVKTSDHVENLDVYCLTVPSSYFLVKRDGQISVTGNCHVMMDESIIDILLTDEVYAWGYVFESIKDDVKEIIDSVVAQELSWNDYLFSEGRSIVGLNSNLLHDWVIYNAQPVYAKFGLKCDEPAVVNNPLLWMNNWLDLNKTQNANQEADNTNYRLNSVLDDSEDEIFDL